MRVPLNMKIKPRDLNGEKCTMKNYNYLQTDKSNYKKHLQNCYSKLNNIYSRCPKRKQMQIAKG